MVYMGQAIRDDIKILGHCCVSVCQSVCTKWDDTKISTVSLINHNRCICSPDIRTPSSRRSTSRRCRRPYRHTNTWPWCPSRSRSSCCTRRRRSCSCIARRRHRRRESKSCRFHASFRPRCKLLRI